MTLPQQLVNKPVTACAHVLTGDDGGSDWSMVPKGRGLLVPVKPRREPPPEWKAYGRDDDGNRIPLRLVFVRSRQDPHVPELALQVDNENRYIRLDEDNLFQLITNLRNAGTKWMEIQRLMREPGRWQ